MEPVPIVAQDITITGSNESSYLFKPSLKIAAAGFSTW